MFRDLVVAVPVLGRPRQVEDMLDSLDETTPGCRVVFGCTPGDDDVIAVITGRGREYVVVPRQQFGDYARKINTVASGTSEPWLFCGASDLIFRERWFEEALALSGPGIGVVGTNDLGSQRVINGEHSTHSLVARWYIDVGTIDEPGKVLHEGYVHEFVDDELVGTARHRGAYAHAHGAHVEHMHPDWGKGESDDLYQMQRGRMRTSRRLYARRRRLWEG